MRRTTLLFLIAVALAGCGLSNATQGTATDANMTSSTRMALSDPAERNRVSIDGVLVGPEVLIVDNSVLDRQMLSEELTKRGFRVRTADSSDEGLRLLAEALPDAILMDSEMSGTSPFTVVRTLTTDNRYAHIPIVMLVSQGKDADGITALRQGARSFVVRPIQLMSLEALLHEVLP
jgi:twitching motility two-component system response regulator PilH